MDRRKEPPGPPRMPSDQVFKPPAALIALVPRPRKSSSAGHPGEFGNGPIAAGAVFPHLPGQQPAGALDTFDGAAPERRECNHARSSADTERANQDGGVGRHVQVP